MKRVTRFGEACKSLFVNRDGGIRTRDPLNPIQVRYRAALRPVRVQTADKAFNLAPRAPTFNAHAPSRPRSTPHPTPHSLGLVLMSMIPAVCPVPYRIIASPTLSILTSTTSPAGSPRSDPTGP